MISRSMMKPDFVIRQDRGAIPVITQPRWNGVMAAFQSKNERAILESLPALEQLEAGKPIGAILPMSEKAQRLMRDRIEIIDYLLNQDNVIWN